MNCKLLITLFLMGLRALGQSAPQSQRNKPSNNYQSYGFYNGGRSGGSSDDTVSIEAGKGNHGGDSAPNCPDPLFGIPFVHFGESKKCYLTGVKGPCPENMRLFPQHGSAIGYCDCNCDSYLDNKYHSPRSFCTGQTDSGDIRSLAYVKAWGSCEPLLEQSKCPSGHWLAFGNDPKKGPYCERAVCEVLLYDLKFYDKETGRCERLDGPCRASSPSKRGTSQGSYQIQDSDWIPQCVPESQGNLIRSHPDEPGTGKGVSGGVISLNCPLGFKYSQITENCQRRTYLGSGVG